MITTKINSFMEYNTQLNRIVLPEYGRNIQKMVEYCRTIEDREERTRCAHSIIDIMGNIFPHLRDVNDFKHILWDHLAIMSDFDLDIDYPYEVVKKEDLLVRPEPMPYSRPTMRYRHYGKTLEKMIKLAADMEGGEEKDQFMDLVASHMKKSYMQWNKEVNDNKIFDDLYELSNGMLDMRNSGIQLPDFKENNNSNHNNNPRQQRKGGRRR